MRQWNWGPNRVGFTVFDYRLWLGGIVEGSSVSESGGPRTTSGENGRLSKSREVCETFFSWTKMRCF